MTKADFRGQYMNFEATRDGDLATIVGVPYSSQLKDRFTGRVKTVTNIPVTIDGREFTWTPTDRTGRELIKAWGDELELWLGKKVQVFHVDGKMLTKAL